MYKVCISHFGVVHHKLYAEWFQHTRNQAYTIL